MSQFSENEIRPDELMKKQQELMAVDIGRLLTKREDFVQSPCPACGKDDYVHKYSKYSLDYVECRNCETLYINPRPNEKVLEWFYKGSVNYQYWNDYIFPASEEARKKKIFIPRVEKVIELCEKYGVEQGSILEVGCAFGTFCEAMAESGTFEKIVGIEPTPGLAETSRQKGIEVIEEVIENIEIGEDDKYNVVVNFEVIEHLGSPEKFVSKCSEFLKPGGILVITCPNGQGFDFKVLGEKCNSIDHEHLNYFNPNSLSILMERLGLEVLDVMTPGVLDAELVRKKILNGEFDISGQPFLKDILIDNWDSKGEAFQDYLKENNMSSNMWIVARK